MEGRKEASAHVQADVRPFRLLTQLATVVGVHPRRVHRGEPPAGAPVAPGPPCRQALDGAAQPARRGGPGRAGSGAAAHSAGSGGRAGAVPGAAAGAILHTIN